MASSGTRVSDAHVEYLRARTIPEDPFLGELRAAGIEAGLPEIHVAPEQGAFLQILTRLCGAREIVEVGTLGGYSAIWMARGLPPEGRIRTIEIDPDHANFAEHWIAKSDVAGMVEVHRGDAREVLGRFADGSADAAFIDADKVGYPVYLRECMRIVRVGGLIVADNAFAFGQLFDAEPTDPGVPFVREFNDLVPTVAGLRAVIAPFGDGCWVGVKVEDR